MEQFPGLVNAGVQVVSDLIGSSHHHLSQNRNPCETGVMDHENVTWPSQILGLEHAQNISKTPKNAKKGPYNYQPPIEHHFRNAAGPWEVRVDKPF